MEVGIQRSSTMTKSTIIIPEKPQTLGLRAFINPLFLEWWKTT